MRRILLVVMAIVSIAAIGVGTALAISSYTGNVSSPYTNSAAPTVTASTSGGSSGAGACTTPRIGTVYTIDCPTMTVDAASPSYTVSIAISGGTPSASVTFSGTSSETICANSALNGSGAGTFSCTVTPTAASGTASTTISFSGP